MAKTEKLLHRIDELERQTGIRRTIFAACPNSPTVIRAALRAATDTLTRSVEALR